MENLALGFVLTRSQLRDRGTLDCWLIESGWLGFEVSHPGDKNKDVARVGHPILCWVESG
jgi:hypothetical protein